MAGALRRIVTERVWSCFQMDGVIMTPSVVATTTQLLGEQASVRTLTRKATAAPESWSEARADAGGRRLQRLVRLGATSDHLRAGGRPRPRRAGGWSARGRPAGAACPMGSPRGPAAPAQ